ncbi:MAG: hypothetical protein ACM3Q4_00435 [Acidobacteriota bacterium]
MKKYIVIAATLLIVFSTAFAIHYDIINTRIGIGAQATAYGPDRDTIYKISLESQYVPPQRIDTCEVTEPAPGYYETSFVNITIVDQNNYMTLVNKNYSVQGQLNDELTISSPSAAPLITITNSSSSTGYVDVVITADEF